MDRFVIDTNVFIFMHQFNQQLWLSKLDGFLAGSKDVSFHVTTHILNEMPFLKGSTMATFKKIVEAHHVKDDELAALKERMKERNPAQDPDLTLLLVADRFQSAKGKAAGGDVTWLVSDDFKLVEQARKVNPDIKILTPGAFMLKLATITADAGLKRFFKAMEKKVTEYSIKYILSRKDIYPAAQKLSWLIDRTASLVGGEIQKEEHGQAAMDLVRARTTGIASSEIGEEDLDRLRIADLHVNGHPLDAKQRASIAHVEEPLESLKGHMAVLAKVKQHVIDGQLDKAREGIKGIDVHVLDTLVRARYENKETFPFLHLVYTLEMYRITFMHAYIHLNAGDLPGALDALTSCAYWALQGRQDAMLLSSVYTKAMIYFFNLTGIHELASEAIDHFDTALAIARGTGDVGTEIKCLLGKAIAAFQVDRHDDARQWIQEVRAVASEHPIAAASAFSELADCFLVFGKAEYATFLYDEALEASIVGGADHKKRALLDKMQRSYIIAGAKEQQGEATHDAGTIDQLLDESFHLGTDAHVEAYNEEIMKLAMLNSLQHEPFPHVYKDWTPLARADPKLAEPFEIIDIEDMGGLKSRVTAYSPSLGLVGIVIPAALSITGPAESYTLQLAKTSQVKSRVVEGELFEKKLIRGLVYVKTKDDFHLVKQVPAFLQVPA